MIRHDHGNQPKRQPTGDYSVGYARPPTHTRFQPGQSGNPRGRTMGVRNFATDVRATLDMPVQVKGDKARKISTQEAALLRLREQALNGEHRALERLFTLASRYGDDAPPPAPDNLSAEDDAILKNHEARLIRPPEPADEPNPIRVSDSTGDPNNNEAGEAGPEKRESLP